MLIKEALLESELVRVKTFLKQNGLDLDLDLTTTIYLEENDEIIATLSKYKHILKCFCVDEQYRGLSIGAQMVNYMIQSLAQDGIYHYQVFTENKNKEVFIKMNFRLLASTDHVSILEGGIQTIYHIIGEIKSKFVHKFGVLPADVDIGTMVVNCNPITKGHLQLIEESSKKHQYFIVFVVEEDKSLFSFTERLSLVYLALNHLANIIVLPSTHYIVSNLTFPNYFIKDETKRNEEYAKIDALLFKNYFMKELNINKRYLGTETAKFMIDYNNALQNVLHEQALIVNRFTYNDKVISASLVRKLILENKIEEALDYVPQSVKSLIKNMAIEKYETSRK